MFSYSMHKSTEVKQLCTHPTSGAWPPPDTCDVGSSLDSGQGDRKHGLGDVYMRLQGLHDQLAPGHCLSDFGWEGLYGLT